MKSLLTSIAGIGLLAALATAQPQPRYTITDLGTLGGPGTNSSGFDINNAGWVAGSSNLVPGGPQHAFLWYGGGALKDLGTLGGAACPNCNSEADGPNSRGEAAVGSETASTDPNGEDFCEYGTHLQCLGAIWKNGRLAALPNLHGGNNANAFELNNRGQVVGFAEDGTYDLTCVMPYQKQRFQAVIWGPNGGIQTLRPLPGDTVAFAVGINEGGQVIGSSGSCANTSLPPLYPSSPHAVLWEKDGSPTDLGNLGGAINGAASLNNRGDVVGAASVEDGTIHAFLWTRQTGKMQDLGAYPGAFVTVAPCCNTINSRREVVGFAIDASGSRALIWHPGATTPTDLNTLIPAGSPWYLQAADAINDAGEIAGVGAINGETHAFLATPVYGEPGGQSVSSAALNPTSTVAAPENGRKFRTVPFRLGGR